MKPARQTASAPELDVERVRRDFPILERRVHGKPLAYLDNAASTQKPVVVLDAIDRYYRTECSNVHRGLHELSMRATANYEEARVKVQRYIGAADSSEIIFTSGTTDAINLVAHAFGDSHIGSGDEIVLTQLEHHSNIVPWQLLAERRGARIRVAPIDDSGELMLDDLEKLLGPRTRLVCVGHTSNAIGTHNPIERIARLAHDHGAHVLVDGAQAMAHEKVDVQSLDCDFFAFSGHKMFGPTGIGVLYGKAALLDAMPPYRGGGDMIHSVTFEKTTYKDPPHRFEAGTPNIAGAIGLGAAVDYLDRVGIESVTRAEQGLLAHVTRALSAVPGVRLVGTARRKSAIVSFTVEGIHPHDIGTVLDTEGIAVRAGHHCAQPLMERFGLPATVRASLALYNTRQEVDRLAQALSRSIEMFR